METVNDFASSVAHQAVFGNQMGEFTIIQISNPYKSFDIESHIIEFRKFFGCGAEMRAEPIKILAREHLELVNQILSLHIRMANCEQGAKSEILFSPDKESFVCLDVLETTMSLHVYKRTNPKWGPYQCSLHLSLPYTKEQNSCRWLAHSLSSIAQKISAESKPQ